MITNYSDPTDFKKSTIEIEFENCDKAVVYRNGECYIAKLCDGCLVVELTGGEGVFVIPLKK